ncbi:MAG: 2-oxo-hepta-3-ene-1,7-dioic acid hydratase [Gammaproteobacteria bacterium]|nr:2-oxo-hepta-3-ene-1,7-dioic acid hydratase [Gammaproteobacteria bacterium]
MIDSEIKRVAERLHEAEARAERIKQTSLEYPQITIEDAYAIQREWCKIKISEGQMIKGHKIGLTSRAMQKQAEIDEPDFGALFDKMFFEAGSEIECQKLLTPMVEVELAFILGDRLEGDEVTVFDVIEATRFVTPALEIIDFRNNGTDPGQHQSRTVMDTIADNAANAGVILGGRAVRPMDLDLRWVSALLYKNGIIEETGVAAGVLNNPVNGIVWLAKKLAPFDIALEPDQVVLAGSFTRPVPVAPGDSIHGDFGSLGSITCRFC